MNLDNALWQYALRLYAKPGVESACLALQGHGFSVNRVLHALWASEQGVRVAQCDLAAADTWRAKFTTEQRCLRYALRDEKQTNRHMGLETAYVAMKKAELACEQVELALLCEGSHVDEHSLDHDARSRLALENFAEVYRQTLKENTLQTADIADDVSLLFAQLAYSLPDNWHERL